MILVPGGAAGDGHPSSLPVDGDVAAVDGEGDAWPPSSGEDSDGPQPVTFHSYYYPPNSAEFPGADSVSMVEKDSAGTFLEIFWQNFNSAQTFHFNLPSTDCTDTRRRPSSPSSFFDGFAQSLLKLSAARRSNFRAFSLAQFTFWLSKRKIFPLMSFYSSFFHHIQ